MATTGFWPVKGSLKDVIDYAENPDKTTEVKYLDDDLHRALSYVSNDTKTDRKMYVSTVNCPKYDPYGAMIATKKQFGKMGGNVAYHGYQSFKPGEVTPEEAHKIGMETARKMWGEEYQIVVTTHLNTDSLHNHFVINSVSFMTGRKFENHVSDHYKLWEISDAICREHNKSVLENATFYSGEKKAYWVRKNGGQTHRDMLRRDVDEALSMTASYAAFCRYLEGLGYHFTRDRNGNHPALIAPGWQRAVRLDRLGDKYTPDAIYDRIIANQRLPELYVTYYPAKRRTPLMELEWEMKRLNRMNSIELMFELFVVMLKLCTGTNFSENKSVPLSPQLREEVRKLDHYIDDMQLLCKYHIGTAEELSAFREETIQKIHVLVQERNGIYNKIRRAAEPEKMELKAKARAVSQKIAPLRKELKCADRIWDRSLDTVKNLLDQERQTEEQVMNRNTTKLYCGDCGRLMAGESGKGCKGIVYHYYKCSGAKRRLGCKKKAIKKHWIEETVVKLTVSKVLTDKAIDRIADAILVMQEQGDTMTPVLKQQLQQCEAEIRNVMKAIRQGIITETTKECLEDLETQRDSLKASILQLQLERRKFTKEEIVEWISKYKYGNINDLDYRKEIIDTFVNSVFVYDDKLVLTYNYKDGTETLTLQEIESVLSSNLTSMCPPKRKPHHLVWFFFLVA